MADILIRGIKVPDDCGSCIFCQNEMFDKFCPLSDSYYDWDESSNESRPDNCPLVPLPEGHGRLIDADTFKADCLAATKEAKPDFIRHEDWLKSCAITMSFCRDIDERPTIVPAEGEDE